MKKFIFAAVFSVIISFFYTSSTTHAADSLQIRPLLYKEKIEGDKTKRGIVDVANGGGKATDVTMNVQMFRQVDDDGTLQFLESDVVKKAIKTDIESFRLKPKEAVRVVFTIDGSKLPQGDIFAAIFATTKTKNTPQAVTPEARVGTLLVLENGKPGPRNLTIPSLSLSRLQIGGSSIRGEMKIRNEADSMQTTGFFPKISTNVSPGGESTKFDGPLVSAGRTRTFDFSIPSNQFGIFRVNIKANDAQTARYVFVVTGVWRYIAPVLALLLLMLIVLISVLTKKNAWHKLTPKFAVFKRKQ